MERGAFGLPLLVPGLVRPSRIEAQGQPELASSWHSCCAARQLIVL